MKKKEVVINNCFGGFGLSDKAYERLIELGIPVKTYKEPKRDPITHLYQNEKKEKVIYDRTKETGEMSGLMLSMSRYWETWLDEERENPLLIQVVKELKKKANGMCAELKIVKIPVDVEYEIDEYDGLESIHETHRSWN